MMIATILKFVLGPLVGHLVDLYKSYNQKQISESQLRRDIEKVILGTFNEVSKTQAEVIMAEAKGENWLQRNWRPVVAVAFAFVVVFYGLITPIMVGWFGMPPVRVGDDLLKWIMDAVVICLGGYIGGRSLEKIASMIMRR
jgi:hypothetical protein